jgi:hypothetical protein
VPSKERVPLRRLARTWIRLADDWSGTAFLAALKAHRLGHLKKKPQTPHEPGLPRMVVRLHDGGTSGKQLAEPSNEATRNSDMCSTK